MRELQDGVIAPGDPQQIGDWRILARLGAGGMGVVYLGERNGTRAAIKTIRADLEVDPTFRKRFEREAAAVTSANSDRIARIIESDLDAAPGYIAFEFYDGPNLRDVVKQGGALDASALQALAIGLAEGLEAIHVEGVVHRDIKPSNVIMTVRGPVIIDFGIAAYEASELTQLTTTGEPIGSPTWMSPEYITTGRAAEPGDVFGWAATIQFAATGQPAFGMGATQPLLYRITNVEPAPHGIAGPLGRLVTQALSKRPESRPSTTEILEVLLPGNTQTGSTPRLRLPLPAPITAGHRMNIGTAPEPLPRVSDTVALPPPPPVPRPPTLPAKSRSPIATLAVVLAALAIGGIVLIGLVGLLFVSRSSTSGPSDVIQIQEGPGIFALPTPIPLAAAPDIPFPGPTPDGPPTPMAVLTPGIVQTYATENGRDTTALQRHVQFVGAYIDARGRPVGDPAAVAGAINDQLDSFGSNQVPMLVVDVSNVDAEGAATIKIRRDSFEAIRFYPDLIERAIDAATGQSPVGSTTDTVSSTLRVLIEGATTLNGLDGLGAAAPALETLEGELDGLAGGGHIELSDPDVQAAFGRFVQAAAEQIAVPRT